MDLEAFKENFEHTPVVEYLNAVPDKPLISVCVQTYQHERYIEECLDSILKQKTNFTFEILLGEDASSDRTREICINYAEKYPDKIRLFLHHRDNNIEICNSPTGRFNFMYNLLSARGEYIALCEGDDYWTDPLKLQKQIDFLEKHPSFNGIGTNSLMYFENSGTEKLFNKKDDESDLDLDFLLKGRKFHTASFLFKNTIQYPKEFTRVLSGDRLLFLLVALQGPIKYLTDVTCVYRKNDGGISSRITSNLMIKDLYFIKILKSKLTIVQLNKMRIFIYETIFKYSHEIYFKHYIYVSSLLLIHSNFSYRSRRLVKKSFHKMIS